MAIEQRPLHHQRGKDAKSLCLSVVVIGASGDLAKSYTFPALAALLKSDGFGSAPPTAVNIFGYARSDIPTDDYRSKLREKITCDERDREEFLAKVQYVRGAYDKPEDFDNLHRILTEAEGEHGDTPVGRLFYFAIPPDAYGPVMTQVKKRCSQHSEQEGSWTRVIVEKPFGRELQSARELNEHMARLFTEDQVFRIDHFLGKDAAQNILITRFANIFLSPVWNRQHVECVHVLMKEDFGAEGRAGFYDVNGVIRDVVQNHVLQVVAVTAMERPVSLSEDDIRDEKTKVIRCMRPIRKEDVVLGQYTAGEGKAGYLEDPDVPDDSKTPTFAQIRLHIDNDRWEGVPFVLTAGKALDETRTEVRIQFRKQPGFLADDACAMRNEFVMRLEPGERMYMRMVVKKAGPEMEHVMADLELNTDERYQDPELMNAYARLILDAINGNQQSFVRRDELEAAWAVLTPLLHAIDNGDGPDLLEYTYGSEGPVKGNA